MPLLSGTTRVTLQSAGVVSVCEALVTLVPSEKVNCVRLAHVRTGRADSEPTAAMES
ncbi:hypothetical protein SAMN04487983_1002382 [Streptomyces sp. yr375]|nr:hypothetical protein SAMN04487983_1002382 [Streptomyces sp. yr375]